jgi:hypothetical protein
MLGRAIGELGWIPKTLHLLNYIADADYRRHCLTQLNRHESRNGLARRVFHGQSGELRQRYREGQEDQLTALGLVVNALVLWTTRYMDAALSHLHTQGVSVKREDIARLSTMGSRHFNVLGAVPLRPERCGPARRTPGPYAIPATSNRNCSSHNSSKSSRRILHRTPRSRSKIKPHPPALPREALTRPAQRAHAHNPHPLYWSTRQIQRSRAFLPQSAFRDWSVWHRCGPGAHRVLISLMSNPAVRSADSLRAALNSSFDTGSFIFSPGFPAGLFPSTVRTYTDTVTENHIR